MTLEDKRKKRQKTSIPRWGRDEMRILEYSLSSASERVDKKTKELVFEQQVSNPVSGKAVTSIFRMVFSAKWGRPTPKDDDVLVACFQLAKASGFNSPRVCFTRAEICRILGWPINGRYFKDIDMAFNRWTGLRIFAENFYFDKRTQSMVDRKFGIIDDAELQDRERYQSLQRAGEKRPQSWFRWSDVMQESFSEGMIKKLDLDVYRQIENAVARKLYRYLDMYFWRGPKQKFDLGTLMHQKLGFKSVNDNYELKRRISPAIAELERLGIVKKQQNRFVSKRGKCEVEFVAGGKNKKKETNPPEPCSHPLVAKLVSIGIQKDAASAFVAKLSEERILDDIGHMQHLESRNLIKVSKAGFLFKLLSSPDPYSRPDGFVSLSSRKEKQVRNRPPKINVQREKIDPTVVEAQNKIAQMSELEAERMLEVALTNCNSLLRTQYLENTEKGNSTFALHYRNMILRQHLLG